MKLDLVLQSTTNRMNYSENKSPVLTELLKGAFLLQQKIADAIALRKNKEPEKALALLESLLRESPNDPNVNYQIAWTHDSMGAEATAAPYYEAALKLGLTEDRHGAFLGLGSTYRCLGQYERSLQILDQALTEFPDDRSLKVFRALTLYNLGRAEESMATLLVQLLETTKDESLKAYEQALLFYSDKLNQTWK